MNEIVTIDFHGDTLLASKQDEEVFVAVKPIAERIGLRWHGQFERLQRDPILSEGIRVTCIYSAGGMQETVCLRLDLVHGWLFTIDHDRVKPELRERVLLYKRECYRVLAEHFLGRAAPAPQREPVEDVARKLEMVAEARQAFGKEVAQQLWIKLGLETVSLMPGYTTAHLKVDLATFANEMVGARFSAGTLAVLIVQYLREVRASTIGEIARALGVSDPSARRTVTMLLHVGALQSVGAERFSLAPA